MILIYDCFNLISCICNLARNVGENLEPDVIVL